MFQQMSLGLAAIYQPVGVTHGATENLAQVAVSPGESTLLFLSGPQFFIALIAGVVMAFAFQFVLTNFSVATDISAGINPFETESESWGKKLRAIEARIGAWTIFIVNVALFIACFLAVKLTLIQDAKLGAIVSVVIWSTYFLLLVWAGSRAVGSLAGAVGSTTSAGLRGVMATVATALGGRVANEQIVKTVEASVDAVTEELKSSLAPDQLRDNIQNYVSQLNIPQAGLQGISHQVSDLLNQANLQSVADSDVLGNLVHLAQSASPEELKSGKLRDSVAEAIGSFSAQTRSEQGQNQQSMNLGGRALQLGLTSLLPVLLERADLSDLDVEHITKQFSTLKQQVSRNAPTGSPSFSIIQSDVENYLLNSPSWYLRSDNLDTGFREVLRDPEADPEQVLQQVQRLNRRYFTQVLSCREELDSQQVQDVADQLEVIRQEVLEQVRDAAEQARSQALRHQVEGYLSSVPKDTLCSEQIQQDFPALLADPEASYEVLGNRLIQFDRNTLQQMLLAGRQDLNEDEIQPILNELEGARDRFLNQSQEEWSQLQAEASEFQARVEAYLRETGSAELTPAGIQQALQTLVDAPEAGGLAVRAGLGQLNRDTLEQTLNQRQDLDQERVYQLLDQVESVRDSILHTPQELAGQAKEQYDRLLSQISDYLQNTNLEELNPEGIRRDLQKLLDHPQAGATALRRRLGQIDRQTLVRLLSQRGDISEEQMNQLIDQIQDGIRSAVRVPQRFAIRTRDRIQDFPSTLADYLRNTDRQELDPEGIRRDLQRLVKHPRAGLEQLRDRFSQMDRETLVALLSEREDISEQEAHQIADRIEAVRDQLLQQAQNAQDQVQSVMNSVLNRIRTTLNSLEQPELNYDGIKRDMQKLFEDPEAGFEALQQRLSQFDRETLVAILSARSDISEEQAEQIIQQIEAARDTVLHQAERLQEEANKRIKALKHQAKEQVEEVQKTAAIAAWWLLGTAVTSVAAAAIAGMLASGGLDVFS